MNIGNLSLNRNGNFLGVISTLTVSMTIMLEKVTTQHPDAPKFEVKARNVAGQAVQVGALWEKEPANGGPKYLSGPLDDPSFAEPLWIAVFPQADGTMTVAWSRPSAPRRNSFDTTRTGNEMVGDFSNNFAVDPAANTGGFADNGFADANGEFTS